MKKEDLLSVPSLTCSYDKNFSTNNPLAWEIPETKEELKDLYTINPEDIFFTEIDKTYFVTKSESKSVQIDTTWETKFELPEPLISLFDPTAISVSDDILKIWTLPENLFNWII